MKRQAISLRTKLASALLALGHIPHEHAKEMTTDQILSLYHWDHYPIPVANGGTDHPSNLMPRLIKEHQYKTAKFDTPYRATADRLAREHAQFRAMLLAKTGQGEAPARRVKYKWPKRKLRSRKFSSRRT